MHIAVCIKQVPVVSAMEFDPETKTLKRDGVPSEVSAFDVRAVIKAVELTQAHGGEVTVLTMGPPQARQALVHCLALGADRGVHLCDRAFAGADTLATAQALALALERLSCDLILCGRNSVDAETGQVGPEVAELLDLPQVTGACSLSIDLDARTLTAERETDRGFETVVSPLPVLVTAAEDLAPERFPRKADRAAAQSKPIEELTASALADDPAVFGIAGSPTWVLGLDAVEDNRKRHMIDAATPEAAVEELVTTLLAHGLFGRWQLDAPTAAAPGTSPVVPNADGKDVLVVAEILASTVRPVTFELLHKANALTQELGGSVSALLAGADVRQHVDTLAAHGARRILVAEDGAIGTATEPFTALLAEVIASSKPGLVILPSTVFGRDVAPRVAARLRIGLTGECIDLSVDERGRVLQHKPAFGGSIVALIASRTQPEMATVRPGMLPAGEPEAGRQAEVVSVGAPTGISRVRVTSSRANAEAAAELEEASVVVGFGKGIGGPENLPVIEALAHVLDGTICTTRDVTDAGWLPRQYQVGLTGRAIAPQLYFAVAVRGAFEHTVGIRRAGLVVAINRNPKAPIFKACDYGILGDYTVCMPLLTQRLREAKASSGAAGH